LSIGAGVFQDLEENDIQGLNQDPSENKTQGLGPDQRENKTRVPDQNPSKNNKRRNHQVQIVGISLQVRPQVNKIKARKNQNQRA
jgi:hypothetical protein